MRPDSDQYIISKGNQFALANLVENIFLADF